MTRLLEEELSHIPRSHKGSTQNVFRMLYTHHRRRDLANNPSAPARNALHAAVRAVEAGHNAVSPAFEWEFFRPGGGSTQMMRNEASGDIDVMTRLGKAEIPRGGGGRNGRHT